MIYPIEIKGKTKKQVTKLNLSGCDLTEVPDNIYDYPNLTKLILSNNKITSIPKEIRKLKKLKVLDLANNEISVLQSAVFYLPKLSTLNLYGNNIKKFPKQIYNSKISKLIVGKNPIEESEKAKLVGFCEVVGLGAISTANQSTEIPTQKKAIMKESIFISYSHEDKKWLKKVNTLLVSLKRYYKNVETWSDEEIIASDVWKDKIGNALEKATIAILLVSPDFMASDFIANEELQPILNKAAVNGTKIITLIVRPTPFLEESGILKYQAVNDPKKPLSALQDAGQEWTLVEMANTLKKLLSDSSSEVVL